MDEYKNQRLERHFQMCFTRKSMIFTLALLCFVSLVNSTAKVTKDKRMISPIYNNNTSTSSNSNSNSNTSSGRSNSKRVRTSDLSTIPFPFDSDKSERSSKRKSSRRKNGSKNETIASSVSPSSTKSVALLQDSEGSKSLPWESSFNFTKDLVNKSLQRLRGKLERATNNRRGSRGPGGGKKDVGLDASQSNNLTSIAVNDSVRSFPNGTANNESSAAEAKGNAKGPKQSWLAVASAVAHSTAAETKDQTSSSSTSISAADAQHDDSKPTKYHYYPHNQHLYLLPECATQQVCSAVYLRLNYSQPLCACPTFHEPCSISTRTDDRHTIPLQTGTNSQVLTLVKTCEPTQEVRECRAPKDWSILALQNSRTGKAHYLVICRCPSPGYLEGPIAHSQPAYARVPGIRVYGMTCVRFPSRTGKSTRLEEEPRGPLPTFPWYKLKALFHSFT